MDTAKLLRYIREHDSVTRLVSARVGVNQWSEGYDVGVYDDGYGRLYVLRESLGVCGIVRAQTYETAHEICEDEFYSEADETVEDIEREYGTEWSDHAHFQEQYGFRPNGPNERDKRRHGIYAKDLNGDSLDVVSADLAERLELGFVIDVEGSYWVSCGCCGYSETIDVCILSADGSAQQDFERAYKCIDCSASDHVALALNGCEYARGVYDIRPLSGAGGAE